MIGTMGGIVVIVSDQQKAVEFYSQKLGFEIKTDISFVGIRWIEVAPKDSQSTISLMLPNVQMMSNEGVVEATRRVLEQKRAYGFIQTICNQHTKNLRIRELISVNLKSRNGEA